MLPLKGNMRDNTKRKLQRKNEWLKRKQADVFTFDACHFYGVKNDLGEYYHGFTDQADGRVVHFSHTIFEGSLTGDVAKAEAMAKHLDEMIDGRRHEVHGVGGWRSIGDFPNPGQFDPQNRVRPSAFTTA
jgi:hypothetical protein